MLTFNDVLSKDEVTQLEGSHHINKLGSSSA
jgi:hypothetical protein